MVAAVAIVPWGAKRPSAIPMPLPVREVSRILAGIIHHREYHVSLGPGNLDKGYGYPLLPQELNDKNKHLVSYPWIHLHNSHW